MGVSCTVSKLSDRFAFFDFNYQSVNCVSSRKREIFRDKRVNLLKNCPEDAVPFPVRGSLHGFNFICEAPTGPMTATDEKIRQNTTTACVEILTD